MFVGADRGQADRGRAREDDGPGTGRLDGAGDRAPRRVEHPEHERRRRHGRRRERQGAARAGQSRPAAAPRVEQKQTYEAALEKKIERHDRKDARPRPRGRDRQRRPRHEQERTRRATTYTKPVHRAQQRSRSTRTTSRRDFTGPAGSNVDERHRSASAARARARTQRPARRTQTYTEEHDAGSKRRELRHGQCDDAARHGQAPVGVGAARQRGRDARPTITDTWRRRSVPPPASSATRDGARRGAGDRGRRSTRRRRRPRRPQLEQPRAARTRCSISSSTS